jgi:hypothetical protein
MLLLLFLLLLFQLLADLQKIHQAAAAAAFGLKLTSLQSGRLLSLHAKRICRRLTEQLG